MTEVQRNTRLSEAIASASLEQATAEIAAQRALVRVVPRMPNESEIKSTGVKLGIPFEIENSGKTPALRLAMSLGATLLRKGEEFHIKRQWLNRGSMPFLAAQKTYPEAPRSPLRPVTETVPVLDVNGINVPAKSQDTDDFVDGKSEVMVFGRLEYSDFAGRHVADFCNSIWVLNPGETRDTTDPNSMRCSRYNHETDYYSMPLEPPQRPLPDFVNSEVTCIAPKN